MASASLNVFHTAGVYTLYEVTLFFYFSRKDSLIDLFPASKSACKGSS